jgi:hypothetical protein
VNGVVQLWLAWADAAELLAGQTIICHSVRRAGVELRAAALDGSAVRQSLTTDNQFVDRDNRAEPYGVRAGGRQERQSWFSVNARGDGTFNRVPRRTRCARQWRARGHES